MMRLVSSNKNIDMVLDRIGIGADYEGDGEGVKTCPRCNQQTLVRKASMDGTYKWVCENCGAERGPFPKDTGKDVA